MPEVIDLTSDTEAPPRLRRTGPRAVHNDADLCIVSESIRYDDQPATPPQPRAPPPAAPRSISPDGSCVVSAQFPPQGAARAPKRQRSAGDDSPQVVALKRGINPLEDYPHPRFDCSRLPFNPQSASSFCRKCFCFVCDVHAAQCQQWADHCRAIDNDVWKRKRRDVRKATKRYERGVDLLAKEARRLEKRARTEQERTLVLEALGDTRNLAEIIAEQVDIVAQCHNRVTPDTSGLPLSATQTAPAATQAPASNPRLALQRHGAGLHSVSPVPELLPRTLPVATNVAHTNPPARPALFGRSPLLPRNGATLPSLAQLYRDLRAVNALPPPFIPSAAARCTANALAPIGLFRAADADATESEKDSDFPHYSEESQEVSRSDDNSIEQGEPECVAELQGNATEAAKSGANADERPAKQRKKSAAPQSKAPKRNGNAAPDCFSLNSRAQKPPFAVNSLYVHRSVERPRPKKHSKARSTDHDNRKPQAAQDSQSRVHKKHKSKRPNRR